MPALVVVEGNDDLAALGKILSLRHNFSRLTRTEELTDAWARRLAPLHTSNQTSRSLIRPEPVPGFFTNGELLIAVVVAGGISEMATKVQVSLKNMGVQEFVAVAIFDADSSGEANIRRFASSFSPGSLAAPFNQFATPGWMSDGRRRYGVFVLPDGIRGCLESILCASAEISYGPLLSHATTYVASAPIDYRPSSQSACAKEKAIVGSMNGLLKPGKSQQTAIEDREWLNRDSWTHPRISPFVNFLDALVAG